MAAPDIQPAPGTFTPPEPEGLSLPQGATLGTPGAFAEPQQEQAPAQPSATQRGNDYLRQQREPFRQELEADPDLRNALAAIVSKENPTAGTGVVESLFNRTAYMRDHGRNVSLGHMMGADDPDNAFYAPVRAGQVGSEWARLQQHPAELAARNANIDEALGGSNYIKGHTDQGSKHDPNYDAGGIGVNWNGERFNHWGGGPGGQAAAQAWTAAQQHAAFGADGDNSQLPTLPMRGDGKTTGPKVVGGFKSRNAAFDGEPKDSQNYFLRQEPDRTYSWVPNSQAAPGSNPYALDSNAQNFGFASSAVPMGAAQNQWGLLAKNVMPGLAHGVAGLLDMPGDLVDWGTTKFENLFGAQPLNPNFHFGGHAMGLLDYLNIPHNQVGEGWGADLGYGAGVNLGFSLPLIATGMGLAPLMGRDAIAATATAGKSIVSRGLGRYLLGFADHPISMPIEESMLALGAGAGGAEAHDLYTSQTGRTGDVGDVAAQIIGGGLFNAARLGMFEVGKLGFSKAFGGANGALSKMAAEAHGMPTDDAFTGPGGIGRVVANPAIGKEVADSYLRGTFEAQMSNVNDHFGAFNTVDPADSGAFLAARHEAIRDGAYDWLKKTAQEERQTWSNVPVLPEGAEVRPAGFDSQTGAAFDGVYSNDGTYLGHPEEFRGNVNREMPRDYSRTQNLFDQTKRDHFQDTLRPASSFPSQVEKLLFPVGVGGRGRGEVIGTETERVPNYVELNQPQGAGETTEVNPIFTGTPQQRGLSQIDTLGRGHDVVAQLNKMILDESAVQGRAVDRAYIGYLKQFRNSLLEDMTSAEGATAKEIEAFRGAMAYSAKRAEIVDSPEMQAILQGENVDQALNKLLSSNAHGARAAEVLHALADQKYGTNGILNAAKDTLRQKYINAVAPGGFVSQTDHNTFMTRHSGLLAHPDWQDVKTQFEQAAAAERQLNMTPGFHGGQTVLGRGFSTDAVAQRLDRADLYAGAPLETSMNYIEHVANSKSAMGELLRRQGTDPRQLLTLEGQQSALKVTEAQAGTMHYVAGKVIADPDYATKHPGIMAAIDEINPGFSERALALGQVNTATGLLKKAVDLGASYVGAQIGGHVAQHTGSSFVMAGRFASAARQLVSTFGNNLAGIKSQMIVNPQVAPALARSVFGEVPLGQQMKDAVFLHAAIPGFYLSHVSNPNVSPGLGTPGSAASGYGPTGRWWVPSNDEVNQMQAGMQGAQQGPQPAVAPDYGTPAGPKGQKSAIKKLR